MKKIFLSTLFLLLINNSFAKSGFYIGGNLQSVNHDLELTLKSDTLGTIKEESDSDNFLIGLNIGYKFDFNNKFYVAPEISYNIINKTFKMSKKSVNLKEFSDLKDLYSFNVKFGYNFSEKISGFVLLGISKFENIDFNLDLDEYLKQDDDITVNFGFGGEYSISNNLYLTASFLFKHFNSDSKISNSVGFAKLDSKEMISSFNLGLNYYF